MQEDDIHEEIRISEERAAEPAWLAAAILDHPIRNLPNLRAPIQLPGSASVRQAVERMNREAVGCVLVIASDQTLIGVFTERDVLTKVVGQVVDLDAMRVEDLMTPDPECLTLDDDIAYALNKMTVGGFRHIPLVDEYGRPAGLIARRAR